MNRPPQKPGHEDELKQALSARCAELIHEISTPLATVKVHCELAARYLPVLFESYNAAGKTDIPPAQLEAMQKAPDVLIEQITFVQQRMLQYWRDMEELLRHSQAQELGDVFDELRSGPALKFLCVEDDISQQDNVLKLLTPYHLVDIANNGREALKKCSETDYDVALIATRLVDERFDLASLRAHVKRHTKGTESAIPMIIFGLGAPTGHESHIGFDKILSRLPSPDELAHCLRQLAQYRNDHR